MAEVRAEVRRGWIYSGDIGTQICRVDLQNFRNFSEFHHAFDSSCILLTGANGVGKTNILEAISLLPPGRGLRGAKSADWAKFDSGDSSWGCGFALRIGGRGIGDGEQRVSVSGGGNGGGSSKKRVRLNGDNLKRHEDILDYVRVVWLLPQMERVFFDGPSARRRLLDNLTCEFDLSHRQRCVDYDGLVRQRFRLLKEGGRIDDVWLSALESQMAELGVAITAARFDLVRKLNGMCRYGDERFPYSELALGGLLEGWVLDDSAIDAEDKLRQHLGDNRGRDSLSGVSSVGPNCSEVIIYLRRFGVDGGILAEHCSAGECRALLVSMVLSQAYLVAVESGCVPILLLDEACIYLDSGLREVLFSAIGGYPGQCWLTATDRELFKKIDVEECKIHA